MVRLVQWVVSVALFSWLLISFGLSPCHAYNGTDFWADLKTDTKEVFGKDLKGTFFYDMREKGDQRSKVGASTTVLAWKFLSAATGIVYRSDESDRKIDPAISFPVRLGRIPLGADVTLGQIIHLAVPKDSLLGRLEIGPYASKNFNDGHWGAGVNANIKIW